MFPEMSHSRNYSKRSGLLYYMRYREIYIYIYRDRESMYIYIYICIGGDVDILRYRYRRRSKSLCRYPVNSPDAGQRHRFIRALLANLSDPLSAALYRGERGVLQGSAAPSIGAYRRYVGFCITPCTNRFVPLECRSESEDPMLRVFTKGPCL